MKGKLNKAKHIINLTRIKVVKSVGTIKEDKTYWSQYICFESLPQSLTFIQWHYYKKDRIIDKEDITGVHFFNL